MAYYSRVAFTIIGEQKAMLAKLVDYRMTHDDSALAFSMCCIFKNQDDIVIKFQLHQAQWDTDIPEIGAVWRLFNHFDIMMSKTPRDTSFGIFSGAFARVGEGDTDTEVDYFGPRGKDLEVVTRTITSKFAFDPEQRGKPLPGHYVVYEIIEVSPTIYHVCADSVPIGEITGYAKNKWQFHYRANWVNPTPAQEKELWAMINEKIQVLNITSRLTR